MAGAGYKLFNTGDVLTAQQVNEYLQQQVTMVFANATARTTALSGVLAEGMMSYLQDTNAVEVYNGSSWVSVGSTGDITAVTAGTGMSGGGSSGDVTLTNAMATAIDAKGDLIVGTGADTFARLAVGTNGHTLVADSAETTGLKWQAATTPADNFTLVNSGGTTLTGATTITISGITGANQLLILVSGGDSGSSDTISFRFNSDTGSNYNHFGYRNTYAATLSTGDFQEANLLNQTSIGWGRQAASSGTISGFLEVSGGNSSGAKMFTGLSASGGVVENDKRQYAFGGWWNNSSTISSVSIISGLNWTAGTIYVYKA